MSFKANLLKKIEIKELAREISSAIKAAQSGRRIDLDTMRRLLAFSDYRLNETRDLELYLMPADQILVLDNDLAIYKTNLEDVVMRKSPTIKEMVNIRNAIKILNDSKVIVCKKADSLKIVLNHCIDALDLSFDPADIDEIRREGIVSLENKDTKGVVQAVGMLTEILDFAPPPTAFELKNHHIAGISSETPTGKKTFGPISSYFPGENRLFLIKAPLELDEPQNVDFFKQVADGDEKAPIEGQAVFRFLQDMIIGRHAVRT